MISAQSVNVKTMAGDTRPPVPRRVLEIPWIAQIEKAAKRHKTSIVFTSTLRRRLDRRPR